MGPESTTSIYRSSVGDIQIHQGEIIRSLADEVDRFLRGSRHFEDKARSLQRVPDRMANCRVAGDNQYCERFRRHGLKSWPGPGELACTRDHVWLKQSEPRDREPQAAGSA